MASRRQEKTKIAKMVALIQLLAIFIPIGTIFDPCINSNTIFGSFSTPLVSIPLFAGGHNHLGVDGLLPVLRVDAEHGDLCEGQVARSGRNAVSRQGKVVRMRHRGPTVQGGQDSLVRRRSASLLKSE